MATQSSVNVTASGASPIATFDQTQGGSTVKVQQIAPVDATTGVAATIDANGMHVYPSLGTPAQSGPITNTVAGGGATVTLTSPTLVTTGKVGTLQHAAFCGTGSGPFTWTIETVNAAGTPMDRWTVITKADETYDFKAVMTNAIATVAGDGTHVAFQVKCVNNDTNSLNTGTVFGNFIWAEN